MPPFLVDLGLAFRIDFDEQECLDDFVLTHTRKMMSLVTMKSFMDRQKCNKAAAALEAASMMGFNEQTVRKSQTIKANYLRAGRENTKE